MSVCTGCYDREAVPNQRMCAACLQLRNHHLGVMERRVLAKKLDEWAEMAKEEDDQVLAIHCLAARKALQIDHKKPARLGPEARLLCTALVECWAVAHERDHGDINPVAEHLYRRLTRLDRRTQLGPPWPLLV